MTTKTSALLTMSIATFMLSTYSPNITIDLLRLTGHRKTLILNVVAKMVQIVCIKLAFC